MIRRFTEPESGPAAGRYSNLIWLLVLGGLWGSSYLFIKIAVAEIPAFVLVSGRLLLSATILWILLLVSRQQAPRSREQWGAYAVMGLLSGAIPWSLISWSEQYISSGLAALLQATMPILTVILAFLATTDEQIGPRKMIGVGIGFVGVAVLMLPDLRELTVRPGSQAHLLGQLAIVASSISYAGGAIFARSRLRYEPALTATTGQLTMGFIFMLPITVLLFPASELTVPSLAAIASWVALTVLGTVIAYIIYYSLIAQTSATFVSMVTYIIPVFGLVLGALVLAEAFTGGIVLSLALILLGVMLVRS
jgi:drug/metabolite transporter (DMT)-like permease